MTRCREAGVSVRVQDMDLAHADVLENPACNCHHCGVRDQARQDPVLCITSPEFGGQFGRARLVVLGCEVASRSSDECPSSLRRLTRAKVRCEFPHLKVRTRRVWFSRWSIMLSCSAARAVALLLERRGGTGSDGETPFMQVLEKTRDASVQLAHVLDACIWMWHPPNFLNAPSPPPKKNKKRRREERCFEG